MTLSTPLLVVAILACSSENAPLSGDECTAEATYAVLRPSLVKVTGEDAQGTGFVIAKDTVITNMHVVRGSHTVTLELSDGREEAIRLDEIRGDIRLDIALVSADTHDLQAVSMGEVEDLKAGRELLAVGYALGLPGEPKATRGIFSGMVRLPEGVFIQTDAALNPGNSGGPLADFCGRVVGVTTAALSEAENVGLAVPIDSASDVVGLVQAGLGEQIEGLTLVEYMTRMDDIDKDLDTRFDALCEGEEVTGKQCADEFTTATRYAEDQFGAVSPPDEAKEEHEELIAAIKEFTANIESGAEDLSEDDPADALFESGAIDDSRVSDAFCAIQEIADENNIEADVGCDEGDDGGVDPSTIDPVEDTNVDIQDFAFGPPHITVSPGDTVTWTQGSDGAPHDVISTDDPAAFESEILEDEGAEFEFTFEEAGVFPYHCSIHPEMEGQVTVE